MAIVNFTYDSALLNSFVRIGYELYEGDINWIPPFRREVLSQLSLDFPFYRKPGNHHMHFLATDGPVVVGRISAMANRDLKDKDGTSVGTVGFFECIDDYTVAEELLDAAIGWLSAERKLDRIWGPMNFDIWHGYRFMTKGFDQALFYGEPYNKPYYPDFFEQYGFAEKVSWDSVEISGRDVLERMIARGKKRYQSLLEGGYRFESINMHNFNQEMRKLHQVLSVSFSRFPGFTPIPFEEFEYLLGKIRYALHPKLVTFGYDENGALAGFAAAFIELSDAVRSMNGKDGLIAKLKFLYNRRKADRINFYIGGITPQEQSKGSGLGRAGFYHTINQMLEEGYETLLLTLRLKGNLAHALVGRNAPLPQREYALYELNL